MFNLYQKIGLVFMSLIAIITLVYALSFMQNDVSKQVLRENSTCDNACKRVYGKDYGSNYAYCIAPNGDQKPKIAPIIQDNN